MQLSSLKNCIYIRICVSVSHYFRIKVNFSFQENTNCFLNTPLILLKLEFVLPNRDECENGEILTGKHFFDRLIL